MGQLVVSVAATGAFLAYLILTPAGGHSGDEAPEPPAEVVRPSGPLLLQVKAGSKLDPDADGSRLTVEAAVRRELKDPLLTVTGTVVASLRPPRPGADAIWQFNAPEVLTAYTDWVKAGKDIEFLTKQAEAVRDLDEQRVKAQEEVVARVRRLVEAQTSTPKELAAETATLGQYRITGKKEVYEARTAIAVARRNEGALAQQLRQAGLEPALLDSIKEDQDVVMADVPEGALSRVTTGQGVRAAFFGLPGEPFPGTVRSIAPVISRERRSLRLLFTIHDPKDQLRPGMFAEIGLGTDPRMAVLVPADSIVHIGQSDYVLVEAGPNTWRGVEVQAGEARGGMVEIQAGLKGGERVASKGAVLLKPALAQSLRRAGP